MRTVLNIIDKNNEDCPHSIIEIGQSGEQDQAWWTDKLCNTDFIRQLANEFRNMGDHTDKREIYISELSEEDYAEACRIGREMA